MPALSCVLLVEGRSDESFYGSICQTSAIKAAIKVAPPRTLGGRANNKEGVFALLPTLLKQLADGSITRLGVIVDADFVAEHGLGYNRTVARITEIVGEYGYLPVLRRNVSGLLFQSTDGLPDIGLWVMPNNRDDGMLEDWVKSIVISAEAELYDTAVKATASLTSPKFKPIHTVKAEVATWLAWQASPGRGMEHCITAGLVDQGSVRYVQLISWLTHVFT